jgi:hypothetical protein
MVADVGAAQLWWLTERFDDFRGHPIAIVAAGMDAAFGCPCLHQSAIEQARGAALP